MLRFSYAQCNIYENSASAISKELRLIEFLKNKDFNKFLFL